MKGPQFNEVCTLSHEAGVKVSLLESTRKQERIIPCNSTQSVLDDGIKTSWENKFGDDGANISNQTIFIGLEYEFYWGTGIHGKAGFEFDDTTLTYQMINLSQKWRR